jgi:alpha-L-fucosidase
MPERRARHQRGLQSLRRHRLPAWWSDAKLGIFVHWTPASVAGWAPVDSHIGELLAAGRPDALAENPYTEWYQNSLRFPGSSVSRHHREVWGDTPYEAFGDTFREALEKWDPHDWARRFAATGARYVVLVTKHHDGYCLWPSEIANPHRNGWGTGRDVVGELREAVLGAGMRFGVYYSGGLDWTFDDRPIGNLGDMLAAVPGGDYPAYAAAQIRELVRRYRPSVLWTDICWPSRGGSLWPLLEDYYRMVPDGVVNDRWLPIWPVPAVAGTPSVRRLLDRLNARTSQDTGLIPPKPPHFDVRTPEYVVFDRIPREPWECVRGIDQSFGYNRNSAAHHFLDRPELLGMLGDIVSKGGNLLLNVGPRGEDATIPAEQVRALEDLSGWTGADGRSIFASRPWVRPSTTTVEGHELRQWCRDRSLFFQVVEAHAGSTSLTVAGVGALPTTEVLDADGIALAWRPVSGGICVEQPPVAHGVVELRGVVATPLSPGTTARGSAALTS